MSRLLFAACISLLSSSAQAEILDFEAIAPGPAANFTMGDYQFTSPGTMYIRTDSGSNALFPPIGWASPMWSIAQLSRVDGAAFDLLSLDVFAGDGNGLGMPMSVSGIRADGSSFWFSVRLPEFGSSAAIPGTKVFIDFGDELRGIVNARWGNGAEWHQIDNLNVQIAGGSAVPEPVTWALLVTGFGSTGAALRRRRSVAALAA